MGAHDSFAISCTETFCSSWTEQTGRGGESTEEVYPFRRKSQWCFLLPVAFFVGPNGGIVEGVDGPRLIVSNSASGWGEEREFSPSEEACYRGED